MKCVIKDDMEIILNAIKESDIIIYSFPLYIFNVPAPLKTVLDRTTPLASPYVETADDNIYGKHPARFAVKDKRFVLISSCGFYDPKENYDSVYSMFDQMLGKGNYTGIFKGQGEFLRLPNLASQIEEYLSYVENAGMEYMKFGKITEKTRQLLDKPLLSKEEYVNTVNSLFKRLSGEV